MLAKEGLLAEKQKYLEARALENKHKVHIIKQLTEEVEELKWKVPPASEKDSNMLNFIKEEEVGEWVIEDKVEEENKKAKKEADTKRIKFLEAKKQMLQKLEKLNVEGSLYQSHRRVILKEYLELLRERCAKLKEVNEELAINEISLEQLSSDYQLLLSKFNETSAELEASKLLTR